MKLLLVIGFLCALASIAYGSAGWGQAPPEPAPPSNGWGWDGDDGGSRYYYCYTLRRYVRSYYDCPTKSHKKHGKGYSKYQSPRYYPSYPDYDYGRRDQGWGQQQQPQGWGWGSNSYYRR